MEAQNIYSILKEISDSYAKHDKNLKALPEVIDPNVLLSELGLDIVSLPEILQEFQTRFNGKDLHVTDILVPETLNSLTLAKLVNYLSDSLKASIKNRIVVYVDDEEENIFVFKRKFGRRLRLETFTDPRLALDFICHSQEVGLVITDEVMPNLSGNNLCEEVKKLKPNLKFILITGNPDNDNELLYKSLRKNRFYEFINKPVDFEKNGEVYFEMIQGLIEFDW